ncbi:MAG: hypothetical protein GXX96_25560 [Planctomycetaceae bacterium]|nr:hypothetical protein [Planctomycetaceae bacterium]
MMNMCLLDWAVCLAYLVFIIALALGSMRGQRDKEDFFVGGRRMNWFAVGVSMFATSFSSISFLGLPQRGAYQDFSFYLTILLIPLLITPILWVFFIPLYSRLRVNSGYSYLRLRFNSTIQKLGSLLYCGYALGWMGAMLYAMTLTLKSIMDLNDAQYVVVLVGLGTFTTVCAALGGLRAVVWTDVLQATTLSAAIGVILVLAVGGIDGGWTGLWQIGKDGGRWTMFHLQPDLLAKQNFTDVNTVYTAFAFALFMYLPGYAVAQNMIQRYVCTGGLREARGVIVLSSLINAALGFVFLLVGVALFAFYMQPGGLGMPTLEREDQILPHFVATYAPGVGLVGLMLAGLFAAAMSTIASGINGVASVIAYDWAGRKELSLNASRRLTVVLGALVIIAALLAPAFGSNVINIISTVAGTMLGGLLAIFLLGMFVPRANSAGVIVGLLAGAASWTLVLVAKQLPGNPAGLPAAVALALDFAAEVPTWWYGAFTIFPTLIVGAVASLCFAPPQPEALDGAVWGRDTKQTVRR